MGYAGVAEMGRISERELWPDPTVYVVFGKKNVFSEQFLTK